MPDDATTMSPIDDAPVEPAAWPRVVGITSISFGVLSLGCTACGIVGHLVGQMGPRPQNPDGTPIDMPAVLQPSPVQLVSLGLGVPLAALLIAAGIMLVMRRPASRLLHLVYAGLSLLLTAVATVFNVLHLMDQIAWAKQNPDHPMAPFFGGPLVVAITVVVTLLTLAWPIFCLVWFGAVKRDAREINAGVENDGL